MAASATRADGTIVALESDKAQSKLPAFDSFTRTVLTGARNVQSNEQLEAVIRSTFKSFSYAPTDFEVEAVRSVVSREI